MTSKVEIANRALQKIGAERITALTDDNSRAKAVNAMFDLVRDAELQAHFWTFAMKRSELTPLATDPDFGWDKQYQLPSDWLQTFSVEGSNGTVLTEYIHEGRKILTDEDTQINLIYVYQVTDVNEYHATFIEAFAAKLAIELCEIITQSNTKKQVAAADYDNAIMVARRTNAIAIQPVALLEDNWIEARL